jgi:hypothetical protein
METCLRSGRFVESARVMLDAGATLDDPLLEAMLLVDDAWLRELLQQEAQKRAKRFQLECAYTAECDGVKYGRALVEAGADLRLQLKGLVWGKGFE